MSLPDARQGRGAKRSRPIASDGDGTGLTAAEFMAGANSLLEQGHHPLAIGKVNPDKPDKPAGKAPWHSGVTGYDGTDPHPDRVKDWPGNVAARISDGRTRGVEPRYADVRGRCGSRC